MVTKGIIKSIDLLGNTCTVHIPFFETAGNDPIIETATISNTPGSYNGYKVGDAVYVAFEDGKMDTPVVIGKLYLGVEKEKADPRGVSNVEESAATKKATLPADAKLAAEIDSNVPNTTVPYSSLSSIANGLNTLNTNVSQMDKDYGNRFKQIIANTDGMQSTIEQNSDSIRNSVLHKVSEGGEEQNLGDGLTTKGLGWHLDTDKWVIKAYDQNEENTLPAEGLDLFKIDRTTVEISAPIIRLGGYPRTTVIRYAYSDSETTHPDLYNPEYDLDINGPTLDLDKINLDETGENGWASTILSRAENKYIWQWTQTAKYEYNTDNNEWDDIIQDTTVCLTGFQGEKGQDGIQGQDGAQGISIISQVTYYALIHPDYTAGEITTPSLENNLAVSVESNKTVEEHWSTTPPAHTANTREEGWKYWTTIETTKSDETVTFSVPVINEDLNGVYAIAQGKTTNYYGADDPRDLGLSIKEGDCWFQTISSDDEENYNEEMDGRDQGKLYQWNGEIWEDIGGELVANKLTATYINALDITAKKIEILDNSTPPKTIFKADGTKTENKEVQIGGFTVTADSIASDSVYLGPDGIRIGDGFTVSVPNSDNKTEVTLSKEVSQQISAVTYWLSSSCVVHTGTKHNENITVTAMKKVGTNGKEEPDTDAYLWYKHNTAEDWTLTNVSETSHNTLILESESIEDSNIRILATHEGSFNPNSEGINVDTDENIYEREEITFSPLNTPVLDLTNDSAAIAYKVNGEKVTLTDTVESTATLYLNGSAISGATYSWKLAGCDAVDGQALTAQKLIIKDLSANTATATCTASYDGETYTKVFTITKQLKGEDGTSGTSPITLEIENDFDSIPCDYEGNISSDYDWENQTKHTLRLFEGTSPVNFKFLSARPTTDNTDYVIVYSVDPEEITMPESFSDPTNTINSQEIWITGLSADKAKINYTVYKGISETVLATGCFTAEKRKAGSPGQNAVDYYLTASHTQVYYNPSTKTYTPTNGTVEITLWKQEGQNNPVKISGDDLSNFKIKVGANTDAYTPTNGQFSIDIRTNTPIEFYLAGETSASDILLDTETISIVRDGSASVKLELSNEFVSIPCDYAGKVADNVKDQIQQLTQHTLQLFNGTDSVNFKIKNKTQKKSTDTGYWVYFTLPSVTFGYKGSPNTSGVATWTNAIIKNANIDNIDSLENIQITYEVYYAEKLLTTESFRLEKIKSGEPTKVYYIQADCTSVKYTKSTKSYNPGSVNFSFYSQEGTQDPIQLTRTNSEFYYKFEATLNNGNTESSDSYTRLPLSTKPTFTWTPTKPTSSSPATVESYTVRLYKHIDGEYVLVDTETISVVTDGKDGTPGTKGKGVLSTTKFYALVESGDPAPDIPSSTTTFTGWSTTPPAYPQDGEQYDYYELVLTTYDDETATWADQAVKNSMLSVDFINSLGITTKQLIIPDPDDPTEDNQNPVFKASALDGEEIILGGWMIEKDPSPINAGWVFRNKTPQWEPTLTLRQMISFEYIVDTDNWAKANYTWPSSTSSSIPITHLSSALQKLTEDEDLPSYYDYSYNRGVYIFYYLSNTGLRFRICKTNNFKDIYTTYSCRDGATSFSYNQESYYGICDFSNMRSSAILTPGINPPETSSTW
jgi:flagellar basal body rod protein FlgC